jgi:hypothetical protein
MDVFHRLIRIPPNQLLENENYVLKEANALLRCRYLQDKERQTLHRILAELCRRQTVAGERKEQLSAGRPSAPVPVPVPVPVREAVRPLEERPLQSAPRLLGKDEEVELLRMKQEEKRRRREEEEREKRLLHYRNMTWSSESRDRVDYKVNGNVPLSQEPVDAAIKPHLASSVGELFQRLLQTGILSEASKSDDIDYSSVSSAQRPPLPDIELVPSDLRELRNAVVVGLYSGQQCPTCGVRFLGSKSEEYGSHLDWHFKLKRKEKVKRIPTRKWMFPAEDWVKFIDHDNLEDTARSTVFDLEKEEVMTKERKLESCAVLSEDEEVCPICHEAFEQFWEEDHEEWHFKDAVRINEIVYHVTCYEDAKESDGQSSVTVPSEENKLVIEKANNDSSDVDEKVEPHNTSTSLVFESEKTDENRSTLAS